MGPTDGLVRGTKAYATGAPITVPVGEKTLGRLFNVLGEVIDEKPAPEAEEYKLSTVIRINPYSFIYIRKLFCRKFYVKYGSDYLRYLSYN